MNPAPVLKPSKVPPVSATRDLAEQLCPACGLCCNGVLFADLRLQRGDDPKRLTKLGLPLERHGSSFRLPQPCPAHDGQLCRVYADRPARCRSFECRLLQNAHAGEIRTETALRLIAAARHRADKVRTLVRLLGQNDETAPLSRRWQQIMSRPWDLAGPGQTLRLRRKLLLAVHALTRILEKDFLT
jgi:Fe-S-cluster containining protein